jgi:hypothetical protein
VDLEHGSVPLLRPGHLHQHSAECHASSGVGQSPQSPVLTPGRGRVPVPDSVVSRVPEGGGDRFLYAFKPALRAGTAPPHSRQRRPPAPLPGASRRQARRGGGATTHRSRDDKEDRGAPPHTPALTKESSTHALTSTRAPEGYTAPARAASSTRSRTFQPDGSPARGGVGTSLPEPRRAVESWTALI